MSENKFAIEHYSLQELYEVMESIDDLAYPDRALDIYTLLLNKAGKTTKQLRQEYESSLLLEVCATAPIVSFTASDHLLLNNNVLEKLLRIEKLDRDNISLI